MQCLINLIFLFKRLYFDLLIIKSTATCAMGLSLGEYSALCFAGAFSFEDGVKLTKARGTGRTKFNL